MLRPVHQNKWEEDPISAITVEDRDTAPETAHQIPGTATSVGVRDTSNGTALTTRPSVTPADSGDTSLGTAKTRPWFVTTVTRKATELKNANKTVTSVTGANNPVIMPRSVPGVSHAARKDTLLTSVPKTRNNSKQSALSGV